VFDVVFSFPHGGEECNFLRGVTVIDVIWKPVNRLEDLFFDAHDRILVETEGNPQWKANKSPFWRVLDSVT